MKCFFIGMAGALLLLFTAAVLTPLYSDYRARSETNSWLAQVKPVQAIIEESAMRNRTLHDAAIGIDSGTLSIAGTDLFEITSTGTIILRGGSDGQVIILVPALQGGRLIWRCIGGSTTAVPAECQGRA